MDVSVFIPVHNGEKYLAQAIESVLCQTHRELELVVIDDGSTDGSLAIMERYARADRRVRVVTQENRGVTATGNRGLEEARGDWVARLDADDLFFPEKIERQLAFVKRHPDLRIAGTRGWFINDRGRSLGLVGTEGPFTREEFLRRRQSGEPIYFIHSSTLMHRETMLAIGGYRTQFVQAEDVDLWLRAAERGYLLLKHPEPLVLYRIHRESLTMARNAEQKLCHRWVMACAQARRKGLPEPCFAMFRAAERHRPPGEKVCAFLLEAGERLYQRAALHYAGGAYPSLAACLLASLALNPGHVIPRLYDRKIAPMLPGGFPAASAPDTAVLGGKEACGYASGK
jgi:glycosyltransferase involved in cell wall biosynthesis